MAAKSNVSSKNASSNISFKDSIKTKLVSILLAVATVPLTIAVIVSYQTSTTKAKNDALNLLTSDAKVVEGKFATIVQQNVIALQTCASAQSTIDYLKTFNQSGADKKRELILAQMDAINTNINDGNTNCILSISTGDQLIRTDRKDSTNIADRAYFQECWANKEALTLPFFTVSLQITLKTDISWIKPEQLPHIHNLRSHRKMNP